MQAWIDTLGKLGPLAVASAVYLANRQQARWSAAIARRAALVEDQKLRLALLDRRLGAIENIRQAYEQFAVEGRVTAEAIKQVSDTVRLAEVVFEKDTRTKLHECQKMLYDWMSAERRLARYIGRDDAKADKATNDLETVENWIIREMGDLGRVLAEASEVTMVPIPNAPQTMVEALTSWWSERR